MSVRTHVLPAIMVLLGVAIVVRTIALGGGAGYLIGPLLMLAGGLRLWVETRSSG